VKVRRSGHPVPRAAGAPGLSCPIPG
jgi:hypothetical protein